MIEYKELAIRDCRNEGYEKAIWPDGKIYYLLNGHHHREDGPAVIWADGSMFWYVNNLLHRDDGPAIVYRNGSKLYYLNGYQVTPDIYHLFSPLELARLGLI